MTRNELKALKEKHEELRLALLKKDRIEREQYIFDIEMAALNYEEKFENVKLIGMNRLFVDLSEIEELKELACSPGKLFAPEEDGLFYLDCRSTGATFNDFIQSKLPDRGAFLLEGGK